MTIKNPYDTFFWNDWEDDRALKSCSDAAQGVWMRMLCIMARSPERGVLLIGQWPASRKEIGAPLARQLGRELGYIEAILDELILSETASLDEAGRIINRRMVKARKLTDLRSEAGKAGAKAKWQKSGKPHGKPDGKTKAPPRPVSDGKDKVIPAAPGKTGCEGDGKPMPSSSFGASNRENLTVETFTAPAGAGAGERDEPDGGSMVGSQKAKSGARGSRLPDRWQPSQASEQFACDLKLNPEQVTPEFIDHWHAVPGAKGVKLDWDATYRNRCRFLAERKGANGKPSSSNPQAGRRSAIRTATIFAAAIRGDGGGGPAGNDGGAQGADGDGARTVGAADVADTERDARDGAEGDRAHAQARR